MTKGARAAVGVALICVSVPFFTATTFFGDDHLFLTFARHVHNPFRAFVSDLHGGEYYRPLWMVFWWLLARVPGSFPFALAALLLHLACGGLLVALLRACGRSARVAWTAGALMVLSPQNLSAAAWFSATTDLLATSLALAALGAVARNRWAGALVATAAACLCKESAYVLPALAVVVLLARDGRMPRGRALGTPAAQLAIVVAVAVARRIVLGGWGGSGEPGPLLSGRLAQIAAGLATTFTGDEIVPIPLALGTGTAILALALWTASRREGGAGRFAQFAFAGVAAAPLLAAGWAMAARYDYLPSVGLCWAAAEAFQNAGSAARVTLAGALLLIGAGQGAARRKDVVSYERRLAAAERAVLAGLVAGHHVFHVDGGIKDLDLAIKENAALEAAGVLVLDDVPASFAIIPPVLASAARPLLAVPPIPPSGAYRFGDVQVVGLARRGDEPDLADVFAGFPDLRLIRLMQAPGGRVVARDATERIRRVLDGEVEAGQD
ncbi:MAG TPA: hypothetical protein VN962_07410 [Polyangia bacterium]|nr:hypothetical protein [Polyangia bacterium]